jgi:hypothetical protein
MFKICFTMFCWFNDVSSKYFTYWARFCYFMVDKVLRYIVDLMIFLDLSFMRFI